MEPDGKAIFVEAVRLCGMGLLHSRFLPFAEKALKGGPADEEAFYQKLATAKRRPEAFFRRLSEQLGKACF